MKSSVSMSETGMMSSSSDAKIPSADDDKLFLTKKGSLPDEEETSEALAESASTIPSKSPGIAVSISKLPGQFLAGPDILTLEKTGHFYFGLT